MVAICPPARNTKEVVRRTFIEAEERPTYEKLADEFSVPLNTIKNWAAEEGWQRMRMANLEMLAEKGDALGVLVRAAKIDRSLVDAAANNLLLAHERITQCLSDIDCKRAVSSRSQTINTLTFALLNLANTAKAAGLVGMPKGLGDEGKSGNGQWNPQLLNQINVTVNTLKEKAAATQAAATAVDEPVSPEAMPVSAPSATTPAA